ncbi:acyl-coenzyme A thioesterase 13-like [Iris pallida]|uniref:Acyl-coenzyme A thioesterase 13 n=1 Tax=Iris pallida TaxID=29817 RepID=A0AAX6E4M6_IRIPA|nr:acyl-coenzyme A thioesterase 13-like [Iris pallida]
MDLEAVKRSLSGGEDGVDKTLTLSLPPKFYNSFVLGGLRVDSIRPGRVLCSFVVPPRSRAAAGNYLHGGVIATLVDVIGSAAIVSGGHTLTSGVSIDLSVSHMDAAFVGEEVEIEAKLLNDSKTLGVAAVEIRKKATGKIIAQGRHTKYLAVSSKL